MRIRYGENPSVCQMSNVKCQNLKFKMGLDNRTRAMLHFCNVTLLYRVALSFYSSMMKEWYYAKS